jgi:hypothetical protein
MFVFEITNLFRQYCDEPDATWLTTGDVATYLATGYREFRWTVSNLAPYTYAINVPIPTAGAVAYDLANPANAVRILGNNLSAGALRMMQLLEVRTPGANASTDLLWTGVQSLRSLESVYRSYYLQGTTLNLSFSPAASLTVTYLPESAVDWTNTATGAGAEYVDDLSLFHDLIALLSYKQYAIRDSNLNQPLMMQLGTRLRELEAYINRRNFEGSKYVRRVMFNSEGG